MTDTTTDSDLGPWIRQVAAALRPEAHRIGGGVARHIAARMPEVEGQGAAETVLVTCRANTSVILDNLMRGVPIDGTVPTDEVIALTRDLVKQGLSGTFVFRAYPIGMQYLIEQWAKGVRDHGPRGPAAIEVARIGTSYMLDWLDLVTSRLAEEHRLELERLARERSLNLVDGVRRVLDDPATDVEAASARLAYPLKGRHVAIILREDAGRTGAAVSVEALIQDWAEALRADHSLVVRVDTRTSWCWLALRPGPLRNGPAMPDSVVAGIGRPAAGAAGFARSHREAADALRVAEQIKGAESAAIRFDDVILAALCSTDPGRTDAFVREELGPLATDDPAARRQRETLEAFYAANCNYRSAAAALGLHHNTVRYRLEQIETALGHPVGERRLNLEMALHLVGIFGVP
ncbi:MAG: helix-turn-helix domain-containing protein [Zavarzinia sp.]|nr:helix-turn-helix domain-containing protein [Zavarzinia sp.]